MREPPSIQNNMTQKCSQRTLRRVEQNDETLKELRIGVGGVEDIEAGIFLEGWEL